MLLWREVQNVNLTLIWEFYNNFFAKRLAIMIRGGNLVNIHFQVCFSTASFYEGTFSDFVENVFTKGNYYNGSLHRCRGLVE